MSNNMWVIGLMSGTSMDGINATFVYSNGEKLERSDFHLIEKYSDNTKKLLFSAFQNFSQLDSKKKNIK